MKLLNVIFSLSLVSLSYAYYQPPKGAPDVKFGTYGTFFKIGRDIYTYGSSLKIGDVVYNPYSDYLSPNVSKFGIGDNNDLYTENYYIKDLDFLCIFCFSFVMDDDSVLTFTGFEDTMASNKSNDYNMGVFCFNPLEKTAPKGNSYRMLQGNPTRREYHQAVMTPDKKSVYMFGGVEDGVNDGDDEYGRSNKTNTSILQFDIGSSTFITHGNFTYIGGSATMLPSGIVVLAFGAFNNSEIDGKALYNTSSVFLYDTNKNELYKQNISGIPPLPRVLASGTLGPDNECIYYFGGNNFDFDNDMLLPGIDNEYPRLQVQYDLVILNTTSWTWLSPNVLGPPTGGRYGHFSLLYDDNTLLIGGGSSQTEGSNGIAVLKNLPLNGESSNFENLEWFTNSEMDKIYNGDTDKNTLSTGAIVGITIGVIIPAIIIFYFIWKNSKTVRGIVWKRRLGEPVWTEILRIIIRIILLGVLLAYIVYAIVRAIDSPNLSEEQVAEKKRMPIPDIRICSDDGTMGVPEVDFGVSCWFQDAQDCSEYFYHVANISALPRLDLDSYHVADCQVFAPPLDMYFDSEQKNSLVISILRELSDVHIGSFYVTYYTNQNNPYRTIFGLDGGDPNMTLQDAYGLIDKEKRSSSMINTFKKDINTSITAEYSLTETRSLTNSSWNYFGFGNIYSTSLDITQNVGTTTPLSTFGEIYDPYFTLTVKPSEYSIRKITEQRVSTILSGLASAGGVFSVIIAIQTLLFGFRPNSLWGIVQRWSCGITGRSLRHQLREGFGTDYTSVPMATRVRDDYHLLETSSISTAFERAPLNEGDDDDDDDQSVVIKVRNMEDSMQLMEDLFKTYYIDDEIFQKLNEARKNKSRKNGDKSDESSFTGVSQDDEETRICKTD